MIMCRSATEEKSFASPDGNRGEIVCQSSREARRNHMPEGERGLSPEILSYAKKQVLSYEIVWTLSSDNFNLSKRMGLFLDRIIPKWKIKKECTHLRKAFKRMFAFQKRTYSSKTGHPIVRFLKTVHPSWFLSSQELLLPQSQQHRTGAMKMRAGAGAKATVLTKMIYPRQSNPNGKSTVVLMAEETKTINKRQQPCYTFVVDGDDNNICYAIKRYVHVFEEGDHDKLFDPNENQRPSRQRAKQQQQSKENKKNKWRKSKAKQILYEMLLDGTVPMENTMPLEDIYLLDEEFDKFDFDKFRGRLNRLRAKIKELDSRADEDLEAFRAYKRNHKPSLFSHKGYIQWQGSTAQELLWDDLDAYLKDPNQKPKDLWMSRKEYRDEFPLDAFRDKIKQEIRTQKYIRTLKARARGEKT